MTGWILYIHHLQIYFTRALQKMNCLAFAAGLTSLCSASVHNATSCLVAIAQTFRTYARFHKIQSSEACLRVILCIRPKMFLVHSIPDTCSLLFCLKASNRAPYTRKVLLMSVTKVLVGHTAPFFRFELY